MRERPFLGAMMRPRLLLGAALAALVAVVVAAAFAFLWPRESRTFDLGPLEQFAPGTVTTYNLRGGVPALSPDGRVLSNEAFHLVRLEDGEIRALSSKDPHLGCAVPWRPDFEWDGETGWFRNPCHGETYDMGGRRVFGPSPRNLDRFGVEIENGRVIVDLGEIIRGSRWLLPAATDATPAATPTPAPPSRQPTETPTSSRPSADVIQLVIEPTDEVRIAPLDLDYPWERRDAATLIYDVGSGELYLLEADAQVSPFAPIAITRGFRETPSYLVDLATLEMFRIEPLRIQVAYWLDEHRFVSVSETPGVPDRPYVVDLERREAILRPTPGRFVPVSEEALTGGSRLIADASRHGISIVASDGSVVDHLLADDVSVAHGRDAFVGRRPGGELVLARAPDWDLQTLALSVGEVSSSVDWLEDDSAIVVSALEGTYLVDLRTLGTTRLADEPWGRLKVAGRLVLFDTGTFGEPMVAQVYDLDAGEVVATFFDRNWLAPDSHHEFVLARGGFCSGTDENFTLYVFDVESRQMRRLAAGAELFIYASWAPEGELIAAGNGDGGFWIFNARTGEETWFDEAVGLPPDLILSPRWAVGGNRIVLNRGGEHGICD